MGDKKFCQCCKYCNNSRESEFQKIIHLKDTGIVIYKYKISHINEPILDDVFILQNTKNADVSQDAFIPEFEKQKVDCPKCKHLMDNTEKILTSVKYVNRNEIKSICEHCRKKLKPKFPCEKCDNAANKFLTTIGKLLEYPKTKSELKSWMDEQHILKHLFGEGPDMKCEFQSEMFPSDIGLHSNLELLPGSIEIETNYETIKRQLDTLKKESPELFTKLQQQYPDLFSSRAPEDFHTLQLQLGIIRNNHGNVIELMQRKHPQLFVSKTEYDRTQRQLDKLKEENPELFASLQAQHPDLFSGGSGIKNFHKLKQQLEFIKTQHPKEIEKMQQKHPQLFIPKSENNKTKRQLEEMREEFPELFANLQRQYPDLFGVTDIDDVNQIQKRLDFIKTKYPNVYKKAQEKNPLLFSAKSEYTKKREANEKSFRYPPKPEHDNIIGQIDKFKDANPEMFSKLQRQFPDLFKETGGPEDFLNLQQQLQLIKSKHPKEFDKIPQKPTEGDTKKYKYDSKLETEISTKKQANELYPGGEKRKFESSESAKRTETSRRGEGPEKERYRDTEREKSGGVEKAKEGFAKEKKEIAEKGKAGVEKEKSKGAEKEKTRVEKQKSGVTEKEKSRAVEKEKTRGGMTEKGAGVEKEKAKGAEKEKSKGPEKGKSKGADKEKVAGAEKEKAKSAEKEKGAGAEKEKTKGAEKEKVGSAEKEKAKAAEKEKTKGAEKEKVGGAEKEKAKGAEKEKAKDAEKEKAKGAEKEKSGGVEKEKGKGDDALMKEILKAKNQRAGKGSETRISKKSQLQKDEKEKLPKQAEKGKMKQDKAGEDKEGRKTEKTGEQKAEQSIQVTKAMVKVPDISDLDKPGAKKEGQTQAQLRVQRELDAIARTLTKKDGVDETKSMTKFVDIAKNQVEVEAIKNITKENITKHREKKGLEMKMAMQATEKTLAEHNIPVFERTNVNQLQLLPGFYYESQVEISAKRVVIRKRSYDDIQLLKGVKTNVTKKKKMPSYSFLSTVPGIPKSDVSSVEEQMIDQHRYSLFNEDEMIVAQKIVKRKKWFDPKNKFLKKPLLFQHKTSLASIDLPDEDEEPKKEPTKKAQGPHDRSGVICYELSDRQFIEKGWTLLPVVKVVRKINIYRMRPSHPEFNWFEYNRKKGIMFYETGEKLADFDDNARGRWYYRNGKLALDYYKAEDVNAQQRFVIYSNGEPDECGRSRPITILASFDYVGNGIVFDHAGKIRLKYSQSEGVVLDKTLGPATRWKWNDLNDPPVLQHVMVDTQLHFKDPDILRLGNKYKEEVLEKQDDDDMLAIEFDNFLKDQRSKISTKTYKSFPIIMKALKINENFSLRILDQSNVYLTFRDGPNQIKINLGMVLDHSEIIDTDTAEMDEISTIIERMPAKTDSVAGLQRDITRAQNVAKNTRARNERIRRMLPVASVDNLRSGLSRPLRKPLITLTPNSSKTNTRKPSHTNLYYNTRIY